MRREQTGPSRRITVAAKSSVQVRLLAWADASAPQCVGREPPELMGETMPRGKPPSEVGGDALLPIRRRASAAGGSWREMFMQAPYGALVFDPECRRVVEPNAAACALLGRPRGKLVDGELSDWLSAADQQALRRAGDETNRGRALPLAWAARRDDGSMVLLEAMACRLSDGRFMMTLREARQGAEPEVARSAERSRLAGRVHDDLVQLLAAISIRTTMLCQDATGDLRAAAYNLADLAERANRAARALLTHLDPVGPDRLGLMPALAGLVAEMGANYGLVVDLVDLVDRSASACVARMAPGTSYRVLRELLIDVAERGEASAASLELSEIDGRPQFRVFVPIPARRSSGLSSLARRVRQSGGSLEILSVPGHGFEVLLRPPL